MTTPNTPNTPNTSNTSNTSNTLTAPYASAVEAMPHLQIKLCKVWGTPEFAHFLSTLIVDTRSGVRQGLPPAVADEMLFLGELEKTVRVMEMAKQLGVDFATATRMVEQQDMERLKKDHLDDPSISRDLIFTDRDQREATAREAAAQRERNRLIKEERLRREAAKQKSFFAIVSKPLGLIIVAALVFKLWPKLSVLFF